ncbi:MAG: hypothetical protein JHC93_05790 [Parachlamydiales bacterium]|nr:hypothetical protein [Parachlamydiales bacterium]
MELSDIVTVVVIVPETHADMLRDVIAESGGGCGEYYSHGSFSVKGISRFMPKKGSNPFLGQEDVLETVLEERIETICTTDKLEGLIDAIKKAHPYEETSIDIYPIYKRACKSKNND